MKRLLLPAAGSALVLTAMLLGCSAALYGQAQLPPQPLGGPNGGQQNFSGAAKVAGAGPAPEVKAAEPFTSKEGKKGWKVVIPGGRPLATPAVVGGKVLVGGGFGSHEFYAFDAATGKKLWLYRTGDDGPTAAAVEDGYVAFNTESCELEIITMDGQKVWKKWLGDPLMSMPAISKGKVYMAYPDSKGTHKHQFACFDLKTGKEHWKKEIPGDIITAPVINESKIYLATVEGTMSCFNEDDGKLVFSEKKNATSSPTVVGGQCYFSRREAVQVTGKDGKKFGQQTEMLARGQVPQFSPDGKVVVSGGFAGGGFGVHYKTFGATARPADYLDVQKRRAFSKLEESNKSADAGVGFATAPAAANLPLAEGNLGQATVVGVWSYQGSRPFAYKGRLYTAMGDTVKCLDPKTEKVQWKKELHVKKENQPLVDSGVTPPAVVNGKLFLGTAAGEVVCMSIETGEVLWRATVGEPVVFQPAVAGGRVYVATSTGSLYCLETGDTGDDGWLMWGGNAAHNGLGQ